MIELESRRGLDQMLDLADRMGYVPTVQSSSIGHISFIKTVLHHGITGIYFCTLYEYIVDGDSTIEKYWYDFEDKGVSYEV